LPFASRLSLRGVRPMSLPCQSFDISRHTKLCLPLHSAGRNSHRDWSGPSSPASTPPPSVPSCHRYRTCSQHGPVLRTNHRFLITPSMCHRSVASRRAELPIARYVLLLVATRLPTSMSRPTLWDHSIAVLCRCSPTARRWESTSSPQTIACGNIALEIIILGPHAKTVQCQHTKAAPTTIRPCWQLHPWAATLCVSQRSPWW